MKPGGLEFKPHLLHLIEVWSLGKSFNVWELQFPRKKICLGWSAVSKSLRKYKHPELLVEAVSEDANPSFP